jgi:hypothetical protein
VAPPERTARTVRQCHQGRVKELPYPFSFTQNAVIDGILTLLHLISATACVGQSSSNRRRKRNQARVWRGQAVKRARRIASFRPLKAKLENGTQRVPDLKERKRCRRDVNTATGARRAESLEMLHIGCYGSRSFCLKGNSAYASAGSRRNHRVSCHRVGAQ